MNKLKFGLFLTLVVMFATSSLSHAQYRDYIILHSGEKLEGSIKGEKSNRIKFEKSEDKKFIKYVAGEIKEYFVAKDQSTYLSVFLPKAGNPSFLFCEERGPINLLKHKISGGYYPMMGAGGMMMVDTVV